MNIFALSPSPKGSALQMCDKHVVKMILESAQIICTVHHKYPNRNVKYDIPYKMTHANHPCTIWTGVSISNYLWLVRHAKALNEEYKFRYNRQVNHKSWDIIASLPYPNIPLTPMTKFVMAMPDKYKCDDPHEAYRQYYIHEKHGFAKWTNRSVPDWFK